MKALVTGGGGFLGKAIVARLRARGDEVTSFARGAYPELTAMGVTVVRGDLADTEALRRAAAGCDVVFHVAAKPGVWGSFDEFHRANVEGTLHVIDACRAASVTRLVYTSTPSVVFGTVGHEGVDESVPYPRDDEFIADYPRTKAAAERAVLAANGPDLATVALRPHLIWGPGDNHLVPRIVARAKAGRLRKVGTGKYAVDSVYIDNAAEAHVLAADALSPGAPHAGKAYFISQGEPVAIGDLIDRIVEAAGLPKVTRSIPAGVAYAVGAISEVLYRAVGAKNEPLLTRFVAKQLSTPHWFDIGAAKRDFGYTPTISLDEGMKRLGVWLRSGAPATAY